MRPTLKQIAAECKIDLSRIKDQDAEIDILTGKRTCEEPKS